MNGHRPLRSGFLSPDKGTKLRELVCLLLGTNGISDSEIRRRKLISKRDSSVNVMMRLEFYCGFDIRKIAEIKVGDQFLNVYKIVGRHRWHGRYRSFGEFDSIFPNVRS